MYNESSGEMYDAYETKKAKDARKRKLLIRRITTVSILVLVLAYFIILLIDINRYKITQETIKKGDIHGGWQ